MAAVSADIWKLRVEISRTGALVYETAGVGPLPLVGEVVWDFQVNPYVVEAVEVQSDKARTVIKVREGVQ